MKITRYRQIQEILKKGIQHGQYEVGDYLPSENELCKAYQITRTTARKALDELQREGFIVRQHGKGSQVQERRESLGLLTVKGFSEAVNYDIKTEFLQTPIISTWNEDISFQPTNAERISKCIYFARLRHVNGSPFMVENNWLSEKRVSGFVEKKFIQDSFFKTLSQRYFIEIVGSEQELRSLPANEYIANLLDVEVNSPILQITIRYLTSIADFYIYCQLYCNTNKYPIGNSFSLK